MSSDHSPHGLKRQRGQRKFSHNKSRRLRTSSASARPSGSSDEVLLAEVKALMSQDCQENGNETTPSDVVSSNLRDPPFETTVAISQISSTGIGLGLGVENRDARVYAVPFTIGGDTARVRVFRHFELYSLADLIEIREPSQDRDSSLIRCKYFGVCSGCQFQMLPYENQLSHKRNVVLKAFATFSGIPVNQLPAIDPTLPSALQYGYRTKLTPHFDGPPGARQKRRAGVKPSFDTVPPIGFMKQGTRHTIDIEDCPIGTQAVRRGLVRERQKVAATLHNYQRGVTILLRENTRRIVKPEGLGSEHDDGARPVPVDLSVEVPPTQEDSDVIKQESEKYIEFKSCETDQTAIITEYIGDYRFQNPAGAFFQNNNSVLESFCSYIGSLVHSPGTGTSDAGSDDPKYLIDAYCGSGLFTIVLSHLFTQSMGIDISTSSIESARNNATLNNLAPTKATFMAATASELFREVTFPPSQTVVILDPPRKGCDLAFLSQLRAFAPQKIIYVSCNVHTQARDIGELVKGPLETDDTGTSGMAPYRVDVIRGVDFFPMTAHVEGVAVLVKNDQSLPGDSPNAQSQRSTPECVAAERDPHEKISLCNAINGRDFKSSSVSLI